MITREWILAVLAELPVWYWPVFLLDLVELYAWWASDPLAPGGMVTFNVTRTGRILADGWFEPDRPDPCDWTAHAPRAPWAARSPEAISNALAALSGGVARDTVTTPLSHRHDTLATPPFLDSG